MKNLRTSILVLLAAILSISVWSCSDDDDPEPTPELTPEELIVGTWKSVVQSDGVEMTLYYRFKSDKKLLTRVRDKTQLCVGKK